jgi:ATP-binding cassette subfamily C (CFTR/MRP) protein 1
MDPKTDASLHNALFAHAQDKTLLVITHRLENIERYDRIIVMEKGEIVEMGTYNDLLKL